MVRLRFAAGSGQRPRQRVAVRYSMCLSTDMFARKARVIVGSAGILLIAATWFPVIAPAADAPLSIESQGNFYIGGRYVESNGDSPMVGQVYVQFQIPQDRRHPNPIVMVHGGSQTGSGWISTPDGREGWAIYFVRRGYAVYVVAQVARGRAPHNEG